MAITIVVPKNQARKLKDGRMSLDGKLLKLLKMVNFSYKLAAKHEIKYTTYAYLR